MILNTALKTVLQFDSAYDGHCLITIAFMCLYCEGQWFINKAQVIEIVMPMVAGGSDSPCSYWLK